MFAKKDHLRSLLVLFAISTACNSISIIEVVDLQTEGRESPLGIDRKHPRFTWKIKTGEQDVEQTAYQVLVIW